MGKFLDELTEKYIDKPQREKEAEAAKLAAQARTKQIALQHKNDYLNLAWCISDICNSPFGSVMGVLVVTPNAIIDITYTCQHNRDFGFEIPRNRTNEAESDNEISPTKVANILETELNRRLPSVKAKVTAFAKRGSRSGYYGINIQTQNNVPEHPSVTVEKAHRGTLAYYNGLPHIFYTGGRPPQPILIGQKVIIAPGKENIETILMHETLHNKYGNPYDNLYWRGYRGINFPVGTIIKVL
jgi:hypothetical protein